MLVKANARLAISVSAEVIDGAVALSSIVLPIAFEDLINVDKLRPDFMDIVHYTTRSTHISEKPVIDEALLKMRERFKYKTNFGVGIIKNIPTGHGLGSGASNAVAVMKAVAKLEKINAKPEDYLSIAHELKQDVAYFVYNTAALFETNPQRVSPLKFKTKAYVLLIIHPETMEKKHVVADYLTENLTSTLTLDPVISALENGTLSDLGKVIYNDLTPIIIKKVPALAEVLAFLKTQNLEAFGLAGTGATIFALSTNRNLLKYISDKYRKAKFQTIITNVIN